MSEQAARAFYEALCTRDGAGLARALAPTAELNSPITDQLRFQGRDRIVEVSLIVYQPLRDHAHLAVTGRDPVWMHLSRAQIGGRTLTLAHILRFDEADRIEEITVLARPLSSTVAFAAAVIPAMMRRRSRILAAAFGTIARVSAVLFARGDRDAARLLRQTWSS